MALTFIESGSIIWYFSLIILLPFIGSNLWFFSRNLPIVFHTFCFALYTEYVYVLRLKRGDVVLFFDQFTPRIHWKLAVIEERFLGKDSKARACDSNSEENANEKKTAEIKENLD